MSAYDSLVSSGAIAAHKRDILLEASFDVEYLVHIREYFERASAEAAKSATECTIRIVRELLANGMCALATWGQQKGTIVVVERSDEELATILDQYGSRIAFPFDLFLTALPPGEEWVARYKSLVAEL